MADFTATQDRYLAFIHAYINLHGYPPAESEIGAAMCVSPPSVNQMLKTLEKKDLILRQPGRPRSLQLLNPVDEIPPWNSRKPTTTTVGSPPTRMPPMPAQPAKLYVLSVYLLSGPVSKKFANKEMSRVIEIRGDQTLEQLHQAIFTACERWEQHFHEFQFGKRPNDPDGPNYGLPDPSSAEQCMRNVHTTKLDALDLKQDRVFGYLFDFGDDWFHQLQVERIEQAIPTVTYPRVVKRVGKSPPQYGKQ